ncbi:UspA domain protein [Sulfolobus islandicus Y.G.57.14]|jgi:Universal stress protein UspA and related nucleotide-binding proteins|uniref:Universal stress protein UspA-related nucleotide-binding protein n=10 Tax=Saccharolobus islandicus TaxID=43080 RepID=M9UGP7_SACIS|nr:universal stress protein [Sulfolobus islandicus]ACP36639.1 UspA domain protein [Sulfolobus islandicus L.S.2.15]ACP39254.1 UspA domain protein [Sulfolobus islandicus M.14.25]ACP46931.1 UspA domain protein [Sulfolobus islandicus Y.G.57.14]ACP47374.1 UspA domain protein [Sulfolobus islandicus Y.N.15.51]ACP56436.1 UspA domain protein [Sulfolobus islandicus M.16.27]
MKRILVGYDGSENAERALDFAIELASKFSARLFVVEVIDLTLFYNSGVLPPLEATKSLEEKAKKDVKKAIEKAKSKGVDTEGITLEGDPAHSILEFAKDNQVDVIVIGSRGLSKVQRIFLGSVSNKIVQESRIPVIVVK